MTREEMLRLLGGDIVTAASKVAGDVGHRMTSDLNGASAYAAERADHLAMAFGEPGFDEALEAERDSVALVVSAGAVRRADEIDSRILAVLQGSLAIAARALVMLAAV